MVAGPSGGVDNVTVGGGSSGNVLRNQPATSMKVNPEATAPSGLDDAAHARAKPVAAAVLDIDFDADNVSGGQCVQSFASVVLEEFSRDASYAPFLSEDFDATEFTTKTIQGEEVEEQTHKLKDGINKLDKELHKEVVSRHESLLQQVTHIHDMERAVAAVNAGVDTLRTSVKRLREDVCEPFQLMEKQTRQLTNVQSSLEVLRLVLRFMYVLSKLTKQTQGGMKDLTKAAQSMQEIEEMLQSPLVQNIEVVCNSTSFITACGRDVRKQGRRVLISGVKTLNQQEIGAGLQVFFNLGSLEDNVDSAVAAVSQEISNAIVAALDVNSLALEQKAKAQTSASNGGSLGSGDKKDFNSNDGGAGSSIGGANTTSSWRAALTYRLDKLMDTMHEGYLQVWNLQRVLAKKRDPVSHVRFLDEVITEKNKASLTTRLSTLVSQHLTKNIGQACKASTFVKHTLTADYPRVLSLFHNLFRRLQQHTQLSLIEGSEGANELQLFQSSLESLEQGYLSKVVQRLNDVVTNTFAATTAMDATGFMSMIATELQSVESHPKLLKRVTSSCAQSIRQFSAKIESSANTAQDALQTSRPCTPAQLLNAKLFDASHSISSGTELVASCLPPSEATLLMKAADEIRSIGDQIPRAMFRQFRANAESLMLRMHKEISDENVEAGGDTCSGYVRELQSLVGNVTKEIFSHYPKTDLTTSLLRETASRLLVFFVRHLSLLRPLPEMAKLQLTGDMAEVEMALSPLCKLESLGIDYKRLRAMRPVVFLETSEIVEQYLNGSGQRGGDQLSCLLPSSVIHHLLSRGPDELLSPHQRPGYTVTSYSDFMDNAPEEKVFEQVKMCLDEYAKRVVSRGEAQYHPLYRELLEFGPKALTHFKLLEEQRAE